MSDITHTNSPDGPSATGSSNLSLYREASSPADDRSLLPQRRPIVVVLGMHRSGTSLLSNMLHVLGVDMADETDHVSPKNPGGFWERPELIAIHDEILEAIGRPIASPSHVLPFPPAWWRGKPVQSLKRKLVDYVGGELAKSVNPWGFKDPRTCRLLPLWWEVFRELNLEPIYVTALRAPAEASVSMSQKSNVRKLSVANSELMWLSYNYDIARHVTLKAPSLTVNYSDWFADAVAVATRLCEELGIGHDLSAEDIAECAASIVRADYRHQFDEKVSSGSLAGMFYHSLTASNPLGEGELRKLRGQLRLVDMFFKSVAPAVHDLDDAASARAALQAERDELAEREAALSKEFAESTAALESLREAVGALELRLRESEANLQTSGNELQKTREALAASAQSLEAEARARSGAERHLARERKRSRRLLKKAQEWRDTYLAERGAPDLRLEAIEKAAELQRALAAAERRLASAEEERARFVAELDLRDRALAVLRREQAAQTPAVREERIFTWPTDAGGIELSGGIDRADETGISGYVDVAGSCEIVPIVEARVDGLLVAAQTCLAGAQPKGATAPARWRFSLPWQRFGPEHAGKEAVLVVAGVEHELGRATVPADLRAYHMAPAVRAARELGGTVAEAAEYHRWILEHEGPEEVELARSYRADTQTQWPRISVIVHGEDADGLQPTLQSLQTQVYADWQAFCLGAPVEVAEIDPRVRVVDAGELATIIAENGDGLFSFVESGDLLAPAALLHLAEAAQANPGFSLIYSDEDLVDPSSGVRAVPYMKGGWSPDLALAQDYVCRLALVRGDRLGGAIPADGEAVYRLTLTAALSDDGPVIHVPFVLYHRCAANARRRRALAEIAQTVIDSTPLLQGAEVVTGEDGRTKVRWPMPDPEPRVSLIVPTRDRADLLRVCVDGFLHETRYRNLEILIADNDSQEEATKTYLAKVATHPRVRVISCPGPFNFSTINNAAAAEATGQLIGLMNNDLKVLEPDWLSEMVRHAVRPDVGAVGAKLLYEDGTIQHAGITLGIGLASHLYKSSPNGVEGHQGRLSLTQDVSAVTAACLLTRRDVWAEVGGLDEEFPVAYNDVDYCLKVRAAGYRIIWAADAIVYHLESRSRGKDATAEKRERLNRDKACLIDRWGDLLAADPFFNPNFSAQATDPKLSFPSRASAPWQPAIAAQ